MFDDGGTPEEGEEYTTLFAAHEAALLTGGPLLDDRTATAPESTGQLQRDLTCARKLRRVFGGARAETPWPNLGRFRIRRELGRGGFGVVYLAFDPLLNRHVAVKVPRPEILVTPELRRRFENEARAMSPLDHPNLVPVYEVGGLGPSCYIVSAYCPGRNLAQWLAAQSAPVPIRAAAELVATLAHALGYAHARGIVHRDLKPSNVLLASPVASAPGDQPPGADAAGLATPGADAAGLATPGADAAGLATVVPKITDFGLAKNLADSDADLTRSGVVVGTPSYMPPEQAAGRNRAIGPAADVWALGALLYEVLTGRPAFRGDTALDTLDLVRSADPIPPGRLRSQLPADLETICLKCLHKEPAKRYPNGAALGDDLDRFLQGRPIRARRTGLLGRLTLWCRRHPGVAALTAALALLLVAGTVVSTVLAVRATTAESDAKRQLVAARLAQARAVRRSRQPGQRRDGLAAITEAARLAHELKLDAEELSPLRDEMIASLALADVQTVRAWQGLPPGSDDRVGFDFDLTTYARSDRRGNVEVRQVDGDRPLAALPFPGAAPGLAGAFLMRFSPDGRFLAVHYRRGLPGSTTNFRVWDWRTARVAYEPAVPVEGEVAADFSPDGSRLALALRSGTVSVVATADWRESARLHAGYSDAQLAFHPDSKRLAVAVGGGHVQVWDVTARTIERRLSVPSASPHLFGLSWHPSGAVLAAAGDDHNVYLYDTATDLPPAILHGHQSSVVGVSFVADGAFLLSTAWDDTTRLWDPWTRQELLAFPGDTRHVSRDGWRLATRAAVNLTVRELEPIREWRALPVREPLHDWDVSPDSRWLVASASRVQVWDLSLRQQVGELPGKAGRGVCFHPQGRELFTAGTDGLWRWSFEASREGVRVEPLRQLLGVGALERVAVDDQGSRAAVAGENVAFLDLADPAARPRLCRHPQVNGVFLSPDGRWAASTTHNGSDVRVWAVSTGQLIRKLHEGSRITWGGFSPDGRWLVTATGMGFSVWEAATWRLVRDFAADESGDGARDVAFRRDGTVMALAVSATTIQLVETGSWRPLARFSETDATRIRRLRFTPDGERLLVATSTGGVRVWDVRRVRERLAEVGLDWKQPSS